MTRRTTVAAIVLAMIVLAGAAWVLGRAYPSLWCSIVGACNM